VARPGKPDPGAPEIVAHPAHAEQVDFFIGGGAQTAGSRIHFGAQKGALLQAVAEHHLETSLLRRVKVLRIGVNADHFLAPRTKSVAESQGKGVPQVQTRIFSGLTTIIKARTVSRPAFPRSMTCWTRTSAANRTKRRPMSMSVDCSLNSFRSRRAWLRRLPKIRPATVTAMMPLSCCMASLV